MNIPESTLDQLFKNLEEYNPVTNAVMGKVATVLIPLGLALLSILFLVEMTEIRKKFQPDSGGLGSEVLIDFAAKYLIAFVLIMTSGYLVDAIVWFGIQIAKWINSVVSITGTSDAIPQMGKVSFWAKPIVFLFEIFAYIALWLSGVIANILIFLRGIQLYIVKAMAPILIAFFVNDELRSISIGYIKQIMALVLQGALLVLIIGLIPILTANDYLSFASFEGGLWENAGALVKNIMIYVGLILKYIAIIYILISSQSMAKRFVGAM